MSIDIHVGKIQEGREYIYRVYGDTGTEVTEDTYLNIKEAAHWVRYLAHKYDNFTLNPFEGKVESPKIVPITDAELAYITDYIRKK